MNFKKNELIAFFLCFLGFAFSLIFQDMTYWFGFHMILYWIGAVLSFLFSISCVFFIVTKKTYRNNSLTGFCPIISILSIMWTSFIIVAWQSGF